MTIQRQYSLPNCTLLLEGLNETNGNGGLEVRPLLSILMSAECHIVGQGQPLRGGRDFFESLVMAVSRYAQEFLSAVHIPAHATHPQGGTPLVQMQKLGSDRHRLVVQNPENLPSGPIQMDLSTVQLFDLVEAVDQFFADTQTLPSLSRQIAPASRRYATNQEPVTKRAVPLVLGASSLALTSAAFFFLPIPTVERPQPSPKPAESSQTNEDPTSTPASPSPTTQPQSKSLPPETSPTATPAVASPVVAAGPEITDPAKLEPLANQLYGKINQSWKTNPTFTQNLIYRVSVSADGTLVGYKPVNSAALNYAAETPLLNLVAVPTAEKPAPAGPLAQFKVVFTPKGVLEVSPWHGFPPPLPNQAAGQTTPANPASEITNAQQLEDLSKALYTTVNTAWRERPSFDQDLVYRVRLTKEGAIANYEPINSAAANYTQEIPLPGLAKGNIASSEPLAQFRVVFKPSGVLQVSPWRGYPPQ